MDKDKQQLYKQYNEALHKHIQKIQDLNSQYEKQQVDSVQVAQEIQLFFNTWAGKLRINVEPEQQESSKEEVMERIKKMGTPALGGHFLLPKGDFKKHFAKEKEQVLKEQDEFAMQNQKTDIQSAMLARVKQMQKQQEQEQS